jgi:hypothetical protein
MKQIGLLIMVCLSLNLQAQTKKKINKVSYGKGTLYGYWGYNRSVYTKSNLRLIGGGYDFTLKNASAHDNPSHKLKEYVDLGNITVPQFNARIGYYFKNHYALSFGYDHMKYIFDDGNQVLLDGTINPGVDTIWSGTYNNEPVRTDRDHFHYENSNGLNYIRAELTRTDLLFKVGKSFAITSNASFGTGVLLSYNDLTFAGQKDMVTISLSGFALSGHAALKFEFWNLLFLRTGLSGGYMNQLHVKTRPDDASAFARHQYGYLQFDTALGFQFFVEPKHKCNTCPNW